MKRVIEVLPDALGYLLFLVVFLLLPLLGYWLMYLDWRAYWRAMHRAWSLVVQAPQYVIPEWARRQNPLYFEALGVKPTCTEQELKDAYRRMAEQLHPDRGGDRHRFLALREHLDNAMLHLKRNGKL